jgi:hypothetical protein
MVNAHTQKLKVKAREPEITATLIRRTQPRLRFGVNPLDSAEEAD